ncbi:helix-turn-helix transcriptional regulator [Calothrix sp. PCC 6303]|uniref:helix-turn-helix transcriptional regulator n=1 Tax=Calothrix sp. PCC 6303 TaxID=1170562 RepID=UPI0002A03CBF|nr:LuxR C-terminal-related transcriptional regulator [Calothrix sp. PCC 6303]AFZ04439.1 regulatory protein LuxR [Calothrix sp. PCC 6303]
MLSPRLITTKIEDNSQEKQLRGQSFFQEVIEGLQDGIIIISETGKVIHANSNAKSICNNLSLFDFQDLPSPIWRLCESLIESQNLFPLDSFILSDEITININTVIRIRVRWMNLEQIRYPCILVTMENRSESIKNAAIAEAKKYELTTREAEVWFLYRANYSYKQISDQLYITINTVKKHMKNIHAKRYPFTDVA